MSETSKPMKLRYQEAFEELTNVIHNGGKLKYQKDLEIYYFAFELILDEILEPLSGKDHPKYRVDYFKFFFKKGIGRERFERWQDREEKKA